MASDRWMRCKWRWEMWQRGGLRLKMKRRPEYLLRRGEKCKARGSDIDGSGQAESGGRERGWDSGRHGCTLGRGQERERGKWVIT